jgi:hypothetical protein
MMAIEDAPVSTRANRDALDKQQEAKRKKEEMIERKNLQKTQEGLVELSYYWEICNSDVCWKGNPNIVQKMLAWLKSDTAKLEAFKENIIMGVVGFGWNKFAISWSYKGIKRSVDELAAHLGKITREEKNLAPPRSCL